MEFSFSCLFLSDFPAGLAVLPLSLPGFRVPRSELGLVLVDQALVLGDAGMSQIWSLGHLA